MIKIPNFDPGVGLSGSKSQKRIMNIDGNFNIKHRHRKFHVSDIYGYLTSSSWLQFFGAITFGYVLLNFLFTIMYYNLNPNNLGIHVLNSFDSFLECFFFSTQTFTTIGYGHLAPTNHFVSAIAALEGFVGLIYFAFATGLFYGRISRTKIKIKFSKNLLFSYIKGVPCIMFRLLNKNTNVLMNVQAECTLAIKTIDDQNKILYNYFPIELERLRIAMMPFSWTIVHYIDDKSPLYKYSVNKILELDAEILIVIKYFDDTSAQEVYQRHSILFKDLVVAKNFEPCYHFEESGIAVLDHKKINEYIK